MITHAKTTQEEAFQAVSAAYRKLSREHEDLVQKHGEDRRMILGLAEAMKKTDQALADERTRAERAEAAHRLIAADLSQAKAERNAALEDAEKAQAKVTEMEGTAVCAACLVKLPRDPAVMTDHMLKCEKHPIAKVLAALDDISQRFNALSAMISPDGTKEERLGRLVDLAKAMGFRNAEQMFWDEDNPECGHTETDLLLDYGDGPVKADIGICLQDSVIVQRLRVDEESEVVVADDVEAMELIIKDAVGAGGGEE